MKIRIDSKIQKWIVQGSYVVVMLTTTPKAEAQTSALRIADSLYVLGNYTQAINEYAKENSVYSQTQIARAYNAIGNYEKAILQYESLIASNKILQTPRFELGKLFLKTKNPQRASEFFLNLILDQTRNPEYSYFLGLALMETGERKEGAKAFHKAIEMDNAHLRSIFELGKYYVSRQEKDSVLDYVDKGLAFYPNDVSLINLKALALFNNAEYGKAMPLFEELLALEEKKPHIYEKLAYSYYKLWEFGKAKHNYNELLGFKESIPAAYNGLGSVYWKEKKLDSAAFFFKKAIESKKPNLTGEYTALAGLARENNDLKLALEYYQLAFKEDETNYTVYYQICAMVDQLDKDRKRRLFQYESFLQKFGAQKPYVSDMVARRVSELKAEIHFAQD